MWLMTKQGFFSIVQSWEQPDTFLVRSRSKQDLAALLALTGLIKPILMTMDTDYPCRVILSRTEKDTAIEALGREIDYSNFKSMIHREAGQESKSSAYAKIWSIMRETQRPR